MEYDEDLYKTLKSYYKILENLGYYDKPLDNVLILDFLNDFLNGCEDFITNEDIKLLNRILPCISDCLVQPHSINYNQKELNLDSNLIKDSSTLRKTEDTEIRNTENFSYRIIE